MPNQKPKFFTGFDARESERNLVCKLPSRTKQEFKDEADINRLVDRFKKIGSFYNPLSPIQNERRMPQFGDFSALPDIGQALAVVDRANELFNALPAEVREACGHSPANFLALQNNPQMQELLKKYGLAESKKSGAGTSVPATAPVSAPKEPDNNNAVS